MPTNRTQKDNPQETADYLLKKHGQHEAYAVALQGAVDAQDSGDNYRLSVWREVKYLLKQGGSSSEEPVADTGQ
ncbi:MAG: hypothetical protein HOE83_12605 [Alphaproteobacteria bacterium]|jgi:hypothetical protein|nr:hypothetical protein [Alphaproteobacteria bacterium]MBT4084615.1 hypothetical protein [Alphaproteobacteria bacterium]